MKSTSGESGEWLRIRNSISRDFRLAVGLGSVVGDEVVSCCGIGVLQLPDLDRRRVGSPCGGPLSVEENPVGCSDDRNSREVIGLRVEKRFVERRSAVAIDAYVIKASQPPFLRIGGGNLVDSALGNPDFNPGAGSQSGIGGVSGRVKSHGVRCPQNN